MVAEQQGNGETGFINCFRLAEQNIERFYRHFWNEAVHDRRNRVAKIKKTKTTNPPVVFEVYSVEDLTKTLIDMYILHDSSLVVCSSNTPAYFA